MLSLTSTVICDSVLSTSCVIWVKMVLGVVMVVFNDGELAQISQAQAVPYNRKTCTQLSGLNVEGVALATGAAILPNESHSNDRPRCRDPAVLPTHKIKQESGAQVTNVL